MQVFLISFNLVYVLKGFIFEQSAEDIEGRVLYENNLRA